MSAVEYLRERSQLQALPPQLVAAPFLALDTEFMRTNTFFPIFGLLQIGSADRQWLIDPLAVPDLSPLSPLLGPAGPLKVMHACSEDLEVLSAVLPEGLGEVHDTQVALAFLGEGLQLGYQGALKQVLDIDIAKDAARTDWLQRPLTPEQLRYARLDVEHLPALYETLRTRLQARDLWSFYVAECQEVCRLPVPPPAETLWREHGNAWRLSAQGRAALQGLMVWREQEAVVRNVPRGHLLKPTTLFALAWQLPTRVTQLAQVVDMNPRVARRDGEALLALLDEARQRPAAACPPPVPAPLPREAGRLFDALKHSLKPMATQLGLPLEVLWRKRLAERVVDAVVADGLPALPMALTGWRQPWLLAPLQDCLQAHEASWLAWRDLRRVSLPS